MRTRGVKSLDRALENEQIDWLVVSAQYCRDTEEESRVISSHFRKPHEPWGSTRAFVMPVVVRRSRRRVLFQQQSGVE